MSSIQRSGFSLLPILLLVGCSSLSHFDDPSTSPSVLPAITGNVHGGQQPVSGSKVQLYAANNTTDKGAATALLTNPVVTDAGGNFTITGLYTCPTPGTLVYLVASSGNPGLSAGTVNTGLSMMSLLGTCGSLNANTTVSINELTTVAAVFALKPFMLDGTHIGANLTVNPTALSAAFTSATSIVSPFNGQLVPAIPGGVVPPIALYNTLADILAACINSDGTIDQFQLKPCSKLFRYTYDAQGINSTDTLIAMLRMVQFPSNNVQILFGLVGSTGPFQPTLVTYPQDWTYALTVNVPPNPNISSSVYWARLVAIDGQQHIWVLNYSDKIIHVYDQSLNLINTITSESTNTFFIKADPAGNIWAYGSSILSKYAPDGTSLFPPGGINTSLLGFTGANTGFDIDKDGNVWISTFQKYGTSGPSGFMVPCFAKFSNLGVPLFTAPGACFSNASVGPPYAMATDAAGNAYMGTDYPATILKVDANGNSLYGPAGKVSYRGITLQPDPILDELWITDDMYTVKIKGSDGSITHNVRSSLNPTNTSNVTLDGANIFWITSTTDLNSSGIQCSALNAYTPAGGHFTSTQTANSCALGGLKPAGLNYTQGIAIDAYGNIWVVNYGNHTLQKIPAQATPKLKQTL